MPDTLAKSYLKVQYELRPAKQVERRMIIDSLQILLAAGFPIRKYQYTGMGSIYFVDFILFHRYLGIENLVSVEADENAAKRVNFNRPFKLVRLKIDRIGDYIPELDQNVKHVLWLDYDNVISREVCQDLILACSYLTPGSIILVTVDVEPPISIPDGGSTSGWRDYFISETEEYVDVNWSEADFRLTSLPRTNARIINRTVRSGLSGRPGVDFIPLYNFEYKDGHRMLSYGGMVGGRSERKKVVKSGIYSTVYCRQKIDEGTYNIRVPTVTRKERFFLDSAMPCGDNWRPRQFEFSRQDVEAYREIYRFFPAFAELLL